jgi:hypothetical protein
MSEPSRNPRRSQSIAALLNGMAGGDDAAKMARVEARQAWARERCAALRRAQGKADAAWMRLVAPYDDCDEADLPELEEPPEQAEVDAIRAEIDAVIEHGRWPRHLHWSL